MRSEMAKGSLQEEREGRVPAGGWASGDEVSSRVAPPQCGPAELSCKAPVGWTPSGPEIQVGLGRGATSPASVGERLPAGPALPLPGEAGGAASSSLFPSGARLARWAGAGLAPAVPEETGPPAYLICG